MQRTFKTVFLSIFALAATAQNAWPAAADNVELKGPITTKGTTSVFEPAAAGPQDAGSGLGLAPGEEGTMTRDMILVSPENARQLVGKPLAELAGSGLILQLDRKDITFEKLRGIMITVTNNTNRPVAVDGDQARAIVAGKGYLCVPVSAIQQAIVPHHKPSQEFMEILAHVVPAALTVGAAPTLRDFQISRKPVLERYGADELRRKIEYSRFGRRILWSQQKVQGIVYFDGTQPLAEARLEIPATTLFDSKDAATLSAGP